MRVLGSLLLSVMPLFGVQSAASDVLGEDLRITETLNFDVGNAIEGLVSPDQSAKFLASALDSSSLDLSFTNTTITVGAVVSGIAPGAGYLADGRLASFGKFEIVNIIDTEKVLIRRFCDGVIRTRAGFGSGDDPEIILLVGESDRDLSCDGEVTVGQDVIDIPVGKIGFRVLSSHKLPKDLISSEYIDARWQLQNALLWSMFDLKTRQSVTGIPIAVASNSCRCIRKSSAEHLADLIGGNSICVGRFTDENRPGWAERGEPCSGEWKEIEIGIGWDSRHLRPDYWRRAKRGFRDGSEGWEAVSAIEVAESIGNDVDAKVIRWWCDFDDTLPCLPMKSFFFGSPEDWVALRDLIAFWFEDHPRQKGELPHRMHPIQFWRMNLGSELIAPYDFKELERSIVGGPDEWKIVIVPVQYAVLGSTFFKGLVAIDTNRGNLGASGFLQDLHMVVSSSALRRERVRRYVLEWVLADVFQDTGSCSDDDWSCYAGRASGRAGLVYWYGQVQH